MVTERAEQAGCRQTVYDHGRRLVERLAQRDQELAALQTELGRLEAEREGLQQAVVVGAEELQRFAVVSQASMCPPLVAAASATAADGSCADRAGPGSSAAGRQGSRWRTDSRRTSGLRPRGPGAADHGASVECRGGNQQRAADAARPAPEDDARIAGPEAAVLELPPFADGETPGPLSIRNVGSAVAQHRLLDPTPGQPLGGRGAPNRRSVKFRR
jgi:hypothetical protein